MCGLARVNIPDGMHGIDRAYRVQTDVLAPLVRAGDVLCCVEAPPGAGGLVVVEFPCGYLKLTQDRPAPGAMSSARVRFIIKG